MTTRDAKGRFTKGHVVPSEWRESIGKKNRENMLGNEPWNKGMKGMGICKPNSGSFRYGHTHGNRFGSGQEPWNKGMSGYLAGEEHWHWKGGISSENHIWRSRIEYSEWRKAVFKRDDYTCQYCGRCGGYLHAHHIKDFAEEKQLRFNIDNGQTLCRECHYKITFGESMPEDNEWGLTGIVETSSPIAVGESFRLKVTWDAASDDAAGDAELLFIELKET